MAQHAILRFEKHKGNPARPLEAHHERQKDKYASNPDIDTSRANTTSISSSRRDATTTSFRTVSSRRGCRTRKDSTRFVDTLITASPEFFKGKSPKEIQAFFQGRRISSLAGRTGKYRVGGGTHGRENAPPAFDLCSADKGQPPVRKGD